MILGGWNLDEVKGCSLPQKVATDFTAVTSELVGADYEPIAYLGSQVVNGTNYWILALQWKRHKNVCVKWNTKKPYTNLYKLW